MCVCTTYTDLFFKIKTLLLYSLLRMINAQFQMSISNVCIWWFLRYTVQLWSQVNSKCRKSRLLLIVNKNCIGHVLEYTMQTPSPFQSGHIYFVPKDAQCSETYAKPFSDLRKKVPFHKILFYISGTRFMRTWFRNANHGDIR